MINSISLTDFRNHNMCRIQTHGRRNIIITGPNGAGKTAILEAVSMLSGERGMRGAGMGDIARFNGAGGFSIFAILSLPHSVLFPSKLVSNNNDYCLLNISCMPRLS